MVDYSHQNDAFAKKGADQPYLLQKASTATRQDTKNERTSKKKPILAMKNTEMELPTVKRATKRLVKTPVDPSANQKLVNQVVLF